MKKKRNLRPNMKFLYFVTLASVILVVAVVAISVHASSERARREALRAASVKRCIDTSSLSPSPVSQPQVTNTSNINDDNTLRLLTQQASGTYGGNGTSTTLQRTDPTNWCEQQYDQAN